MTASVAGGVSVVEPALDEKPWGGRRLASYGLTLPEDARIGEALVTADATRISSGVASGRTLGEIVRNDPERTIGPIARAAVGNRVTFPLLVKLIDANENLSIQVHPNDEQAASRGRLGKTEAWHVLAAEPGSWLYAGLQLGVPMDTFLEATSRSDGSSAELLRRIPAQPNTTILLPAGTVHALGAGVVVYEIQQPSDVTYRLDDWGRVDANGNPRAMHRDAGAEVMRADLSPDLIAPVELPLGEGRRHLLAACEKFALERIALPGGGRFAVPMKGGPQVITILAGAAWLGDRVLDMGQSGVVWPDASRVTLEATAPTVLLRGWVPNLGHEMDAWAAMPGVDGLAMRQLSGPLPDVRMAMERYRRAEE